MVNLRTPCLDLSAVSNSIPTFKYFVHSDSLGGPLGANTLHWIHCAEFAHGNPRDFSVRHTDRPKLRNCAFERNSDHDPIARISVALWAKQELQVTSRGNAQRRLLQRARPQLRIRTPRRNQPHPPSMTNHFLLLHADDWASHSFNRVITQSPRYAPNSPWRIDKFHISRNFFPNY